MLKRIGVVGGGVMGTGIVRYMLTNGIPVTLIEANAELAGRTRNKLRRVFDGIGKAPEQAQEPSSMWVNGLITGAEMSLLGDCDFIIETVPENLELKKTVLASIERNALPEAVISSNTSALPITTLSAGLSSPARFIGTHFFNPPHVMPLVEVVRGAETAPETVGITMDFFAGTGKRPILVKDCPGFLVNRILGAYINEALWLMDRRDTSIEALEGVVESLGIPMGPLKLGDMVGWDVICAANRTLANSYGERFELPPLLIGMESEGRLGVKTGIGFFNHSTVPPSPTEDLVPGTRQADVETNNRVKERITYSIIAEALRCLDEEVASAADIDEAMILGARLPGGPLASVDEIGLRKVLSDLECLGQRYGARFLPAPVLRTCVLAGKSIAWRG